LLLVFIDLLGELSLVTDGQTGDSDSSSDTVASWVFVGSVDCSDDTSAIEGGESLSVFINLCFDFLEATWLDVLSEESDLCTEVLAFWVFTGCSLSVDALDEVHTGSVFSDLLICGFLVGGGGGGTDLSDLCTEGLALCWLVTSLWEWNGTLGAFAGIQLLDVFLDLSGDFSWVGDGETCLSDLVSDGLASLVFGVTGQWDDGTSALELVHLLLEFVDLCLNRSHLTWLCGDSECSNFLSDVLALWVFLSGNHNGKSQNNQ